MSEQRRQWPAVCVDLETLDTRPGGRILEIGAVCFDPESGWIGPEFEIEVDDSEGSIDFETLKWWMERELEGRAMPGKGAVVKLGSALKRFVSFLLVNTNVEHVKMWAWGSDFDFPILKNAAERTFSPATLPWRYSNQCDARTFCRELGVKRKGAVVHRALADARQEAEAVIEAFSMLRKRGVVAQELNPEAGWNAYRQELLETVGMTRLPRWEDLPEQVRESWCVGVRAAAGGDV